MRTHLLTLFVAALAGAAQGQDPAPPDPLQAPACVHARAELDEARAAVASPPPTSAQSRRIEQSRRAVARICLGEASVRAQPSGRMAQEPLAVTPVPGAPFRAATLAPSAAPTRVGPEPAGPAAPAAVLTACDASGCWDSQAQRLERAGPLLIGPQGACTAQGGLLHCP